MHKSSLEVTERDGVRIITIRQRELTALNNKAFIALIAPHVHTGARIALDLSQIAIIDSGGLRALTTVRNTVRPGGELVLFSPSTFVREIFVLANLTRVFTIRDDRDQALYALRALSSA